MADIHIGVLIGGPGHTQQAPGSWVDTGEWIRPDINHKVFYQRREYLVGADRYFVWAYSPLTDEAVFELLAWFQVTYRRELVTAQKELLSASNEQAKSYTAAVTAGGFAALFALLAQLKEQLTPATLYAAAGLLTVSVALFVGWEILGMFIRGQSGFSIARALNDPDSFHEKIAAHRERTSLSMGRYQIAWYVVSGSSVLAGTACFIILISAMVHGFLLNSFPCAT
jgi:hypothetical protein